MESTIIKKEKEAGNRISSSKTSEQHVKTSRQFQVSNLQEQQFSIGNKIKPNGKVTSLTSSLAKKQHKRRQRSERKEGKKV
jgi:hypothetical protein